MVLLEDSIWILSSLELDLCFHILEQRHLSILPVEETDAPLDQRMLNGFLHLTQLGLLEPTDSGYRPTALLTERMQPLITADVLFSLTDGRQSLVGFFGPDGCATLVPKADAPSLYALATFPLPELEQALEDWCGTAAAAVTLTLMTPENAVLAQEQIEPDEIKTVPAAVSALLKLHTTGSPAS